MAYIQQSVVIDSATCLLKINLPSTQFKFLNLHLTALGANRKAIFHRNNFVTTRMSFTHFPKSHTVLWMESFINQSIEGNKP